MTIDDIFAEKYGITPEGYYRQQLRSGADAASTLLDINRKVNDIWKHEKTEDFIQWMKMISRRALYNIYNKYNLLDSSNTLANFSKMFRQEVKHGGL